MSWSSWKKKEGILPFILSKGNIFNICVLSQCIMHWIYFQNIHTFTYQKALLHTLWLLVFKIVTSLQCIFKRSYSCARGTFLKNTTEARRNQCILKNCTVIIYIRCIFFFFLDIGYCFYWILSLFSFIRRTNLFRVFFFS